MTGLGLWVGLVGGACGSADVFVCLGNDDCTDGGTPGRCEATGRCSFPDDSCDSDHRYGLHAGELAGQCVPAGGETDAGSSTAPGPDDSDTTASIDGSGPLPGDSDASADTTTTGGDPLLEFIDDDQADFGAGQAQGVGWSDGLRLESDTAGTFFSRVFDAEQPVSWTTVRWLPRAPYGKPLPGGGAAERGYSEGNADMSDNLLLLHLEGGGAASAGPGSELLDASGWGHHFTVSTGAGVPWVAGRFGQALADDMISYAYNDTWGEGTFAFGEADFSWSLWASTNVPCVGDVSSNQVYLGIEGEGMDRSHLWLGCRHPASAECSAMGGLGGRPGGSLVANQAASGPRLCGAPELVDGQWHHVAVVKEGHLDEATVTLYFDGEQIDQSGGGYQEPVDFPPGTELALGAFTGGSFPATATLDEVAIWRRALSGSEVAGLYRRGARRLLTSVRVCDDPDCATAGPFVGPDGTEATRFVDPADASAPGTVLSLPSGLEGRYFQYRLELSGTAVLSPVIDEVAVQAATL